MKDYTAMAGKTEMGAHGAEGMTGWKLGSSISYDGYEEVAREARPLLRFFAFAALRLTPALAGGARGMKTLLGICFSRARRRGP